MSGGASSPFVWLCHDESIEWGRVFRRAESFNHLGDTCRLNLNLVSSDQASFIHVQSSWMVEGRNSSSVEVLTLLTAA